MDDFWKSTIWQQTDAAIDMLENAIRACPGELWSANPEPPADYLSGAGEFWYITYHALFWLDCYSSDSLDNFAPPAPFTRSELDPAGILPERVYTKSELLTYLEHGRNRCGAAIASLTGYNARQRCAFEWLDLNRAELLLYAMRHVQHHAAQLNLLLRKQTGSAPRWVRRTKIAFAID